MAYLRIVRVWAHGFAKQEGKTEGRGRTWWCSSPAKGPKRGVSDGRPSRVGWGAALRTRWGRWMEEQKAG